MGFTTTDSDNDMVWLRNVKAHGINIHTGAVVGANGQLPGGMATLVDTAPYYDNDEVKLYNTAVYGGDAIIRTGSEIHISVAPYGAPADTLTTNGNAAYQLEDHDRVYVAYSHFTRGNLVVDTGTNIHATVWHDHGPMATDDSIVATGDPNGAALLVTLYDNDHVSVKETKVLNGNIEISTGVDVDIFPDADDLADFSLVDFNEIPGTELSAHIEDRDMVDLSWVSVRKHDYSRFYSDLGENGEDGGNVRIATGANVFNNDPFVYLAVEMNDDDRVSLYGVVIGHSLNIATGVGANGMVGTLPEGNGTSDQDLVELKYVRQVSWKGSTHVSMGDDDDHLRIYGSTFRGDAMFDGGDGFNTKKVAHTFFAHPPVFLNFVHVCNVGV